MNETVTDVSRKAGDSQIKSRERVAAHGEVFTNPREVNAMLDLVKQETERIDSRFLEPACGDGNFLAEILRRKLKVCTAHVKSKAFTQLDFERNAVIAVSSIYGIEILPDNAQACRERLFDIFVELYHTLFAGNCKTECEDSVRYLLSKNIILGDALDMTTVSEPKQPIIMSEWSFIGDGMVNRRDFKYDLLTKAVPMEGPNLFSDLGDEAFMPDPVKTFQPVYFLNLNAENYGE